MNKPTLPDLGWTNGFRWRETGTLGPYSSSPARGRAHHMVRCVTAIKMRIGLAADFSAVRRKNLKKTMFSAPGCK